MAPNGNARRSTPTNIIPVQKQYGQLRTIATFGQPLDSRSLQAASVYIFQLHADDLAWAKECKERYYKFYLHPKSLKGKGAAQNDVISN